MHDSNNSLVECPVCFKKLKDEFALKGHIRLMKDEAHIAFRQASNTKEENTILPKSLSTPFTGTKLIDRFTTIIEDQEKQYIMQAKQDAFLEKSKDLIAQERENDTAMRNKCYQAGCNDTIQDYDKNIRNYLKQKETDLRAKLTQEFEAKKERELNEIKKSNEQKIENINRENERDSISLISRYGIPILCPWCNADELVEKNSQLYFEIVRLIIREGLGHPECVRWYAPQIALYWDWEYRQYQHWYVENHRRLI